MANQPRQWLVQGLERHLLPALRERGFEVEPLTADQAKSREFRAAFPFGGLRRPTADGIDLVEVQLDKRCAAAFRLNFGIAPKGGLNHPSFGFLAEADVNVQSLPVYYEALSYPVLWRWFRVRRPWFGPSASKIEVERLVASRLDLVDEVEGVLRGRKRGRHIRVVESWQ